MFQIYYRTIESARKTRYNFSVDGCEARSNPSEFEALPFMKKWIVLACAVALLSCALLPSVSFTEDRDTVLLARAIYALGHGESYETKLALGAVVMNRVDNAWFADDLSGVLNEQHQFPIGSRYDDESLSAAHAALSGRRALPADVLYYQATNAAEPWAQTPVKVVGGYAFYDRDGNL